MSSLSETKSKRYCNRGHQRRGKDKVKEDERTEGYKRGKMKVEEATEGSIVKARNAVVATQAKMCRKPIVICRVEMFKEKVLKYLDRTRKKELKAMDFGGFLELKIKHIPRRFATGSCQGSGANQKQWLDEFGGGQEMMLAPIQLQF